MSGFRVSVLTAGRDRPYALGLASALASQGVFLDYLGSSDVDGPELHGTPQVTFMDLRDQRLDASLLRKAFRVVGYYARLIRYAATTRSPIFHILWNNKFEWFDRTLLMLYYKALRKKVVLTAHNVNVGTRDGDDSWWNRVSLRIQYRLSDHIFVHTERMKRELRAEFQVPDHKVSVIPFGINNTVPNTALTTSEARRQLGLGGTDKVLLFFGNIAPYKGLEHLAAAFSELATEDRSYRLVIAGRRKHRDGYWAAIQQTLTRRGFRERTIERIEYIPDDQTEVYFKAADALVLPYTRIGQSGVMVLGYSFGLPVIASDAGSLREEIVEGDTGFVFATGDAADLARTIQRYFESSLYRGLAHQRRKIQEYANERYSWSKAGAMTAEVYASLVSG